LALFVFARNYFVNVAELALGIQPTHPAPGTLASDTLVFDRAWWFVTWPAFLLNYPDKQTKISYSDFASAVNNHRGFEMFRHWPAVEPGHFRIGIKNYFCDAKFMRENFGGLATPSSVRFVIAEEIPLPSFRNLDVACDGR
jgi:hypothetical protein